MTEQEKFYKRLREVIDLFFVGLGIGFLVAFSFVIWIFWISF